MITADWRWVATELNTQSQIGFIYSYFDGNGSSNAKIHGI